MNALPNYHVVHFSEIEPVRCPCGWAKRAFADVPEAPASVHVVQIEDDARIHYHKRMTEIYVVLDGEGHLELDGVLIPVRPMSTVMICPGCRHRAVGRMKIINIPVPAFDPDDEWFD